MNISEIKNQLYSCCQEYLVKRIQGAEQAIASLQQDLTEETKSSAGDKYETGRAMMQLEIEKHSTQLSESVKLKNQLDRIKPDQQHSNVQPGSLVITDQGNYYISISAGQFTIGDKVYFCVSPASPVGLKFLQATTGQVVQFNNRNYKILDIQ